MNLSKRTKISIVIAPAAGVAATTDINSSSVDHQGDGGILFCVQFGAITTAAVTSIKAQGSDDDSTFVDLVGTAQTIADSDDEKLFYIDLVRPIHRYNRVVVDRGTQNAVVASALAIEYGRREYPATHGTGVAGELHMSEIAGTA